MNKLFIWDDMLRIMANYGCRPYDKIRPVNADLFLNLEHNIGAILNIFSIIPHDVSDNSF